MNTERVIGDGALRVIEVDLVIEVEGEGAVDVVIAEIPIFALHRVGNGRIRTVRVQSRWSFCWRI